MRVVVIGGGIVGTASAYYLASRGAAVTLCEKSHIAAGATGFGGGIRTQFTSPVNVDLSLQSLDVWRTFEDSFGVDIHARETGYLFLARRSDTADKLEADAALQRDHGASTEVLDPAEAGEVCPGLRTDQYCLATYSPDDLFVDANLAAQGFADAARTAGTDMRIGTAVTDLRLDDGVEAVVTAEGEIPADVVINAAGAWAPRVLDLAGIDLPLEATLRRQLLVQPARSFRRTLPLTMDHDSGAVFYPEDEDHMIVSGPQASYPRVDPDIVDARRDTDWTIDVLEALADMATYFNDETRLRDEIQGVYASTPDNNPILEETVPGLINAIGFSGHGFMHAPAVGQIVADLALDGSTEVADLGPVSSDRFAEHRTAEQSFI